MHRHLSLGLITLVMLGTSLASADIIAVQQNGKTVYVDGPGTPTGDQAVQSVPAGPSKIYLYYSKSEHRWKRVPPATGAVMRKARSAAADVQQYIAWRAQQPAFRVNYGESRPESAVKPAAPEGASNQQSSSSGPVTESSRGLTAEQLDAIIEEAAAKHGVDSNLVRAVIKVESNYNPHAISRKGAMGLMQLMPSTARSLQVTNPFDARQNIDGGVRHLKQLLQDFDGDLSKSVAAYNAGAGAVQRHGGVPPYAETQAYVRRVNQLYNGDQPLKVNPSQIRVYRDKFGVLTFTNQ